MIPFLPTWAVGPALTALKWLAIVAAIAAVLLGAKNAGRTAERVEQLRREHEAGIRRTQRAGALRDLGDDELDDRLYESGRR